jgi:cytochrome c-type biogenesis protein CcmH
MFWLRIVFVLFAMMPPALAVQPDEMLADPALESRARALSRELRCMVCQNQSIDDSEAPLARDLRILVRDRLKAGDSDRQVLDFLTARYGEFVLLKPPFALNTVLLWLGPVSLLILGAFMIALSVRRRSRRAGETQAVSPLTPAEQARLDRLINDAGG